MAYGFLFYVLAPLGIFGVILACFTVLNDWLTYRELQRKLREEAETR